MGKAPSSQFYWADYRKDVELHLMSFHGRGVWMEMLSCMWEARERGKLEGTYEQLARLLGGNVDEIKTAIAEVSVTKTGDVTVCNDLVTVINRRMFREERERKLTRSRVQRHRESKEKRTSNENITDVSSSSSSSSLKNNKDKCVFGEFKNVLLTEDELRKLDQKFGMSKTLSLIENLSTYLASKGKKYHSHYATILAWERKNRQNAPDDPYKDFPRIGGPDGQKN